MRHIRILVGIRVILKNILNKTSMMKYPYLFFEIVLANEFRNHKYWNNWSRIKRQKISQEKSYINVRNNFIFKFQSRLSKKYLSQVLFSAFRFSLIS